MRKTERKILIPTLDGPIAIYTEHKNCDSFPFKIEKIGIFLIRHAHVPKTPYPEDRVLHIK